MIKDDDDDACCCQFAHCVKSMCKNRQKNKKQIHNSQIKNTWRKILKMTWQNETKHGQDYHRNKRKIMK